MNATLAKRVAERLHGGACSGYQFGINGGDDALAAFVEAADRQRWLGEHADEYSEASDAYEAALLQLARALNVEPTEGSEGT